MDMVKVMKERAQRFLGNVPEEYSFRCSDGRTLRNMQELREALISMTDETFVYHANAKKNDFANWVRDIIKDESLAEDVQEASNRARATKTVADRISFLRKHIG
jgi:hypothetical protein